MPRGYRDRADDSLLTLLGDLPELVTNLVKAEIDAAKAWISRTSKDAVKYLVTVAETVGEEWLQPHLFRFGASSLLNDVLLQRQKLTTGHYSGPDYVTID